MSERRVVFQSSSGTTARKGGAKAGVTRKAVPVSPDFDGCPATGDGGDRVLNILKNRVDSALWAPTPLSTVLALGWPATVTRRARADWYRSDSTAIARSDGLPVAVEGYFAGAKQEAPEATNCHGADRKFRDWHLWLGSAPGKDRRHSVVVETTPAIRARHPEWSLADIHRLARDSTLVRVSGWLLFDQEHPEQVGKTRGTLWEIHPIMRIEVKRGGKWSEMK
jgi:hypothetical protein